MTEAPAARAHKPRPGPAAEKPAPARTAVFALWSVLVVVLLDACTSGVWAIWLDGCVVATAGVICLPALRGAGRWFAISLGLGSAYLVWRFEIPALQVVQAASSGGLVLAFLLLVEVLGVAVRGGGYDAALTAVLGRFTSSAAGIRRVAGAGGFFLSLAGLFMGAVPAAFFALGGEPGRRGLPLALSATRGFAAAVLINPISPLVVLALAASNASLGHFLLCAVPVACLMMALDWLPRSTDRDGSFEVATATAPSADHAWSRAHSLAITATVAVFLLAYDRLALLNINSLIRIGLSVFVAGIVLGTVRPRRFWGMLRALPKTRWASHTSAVPLFAAGGMFGTLLFESGLVEPLVLFVREAQLPWLEFPLLVLLIWALRWLGLAPVISLMILGPAFAPAVSLPPPLYALALAFGGIVGFLGSPLSATNLFVASATGFSPFDVGVRHQGPYVAALAALTSLYAFALAVATG